MHTLSCHNLSYSRALPGGGANVILRDIDICFSAGEVAVIGGAIGAGKSTLLHLLSGLLRPTAGEVRADNEPVSRWVSAHKDIWRRKVGIVFQRAPLLRGITAFENVILPLIPRRMPLLDIRAAGMGVLKQLGADHLAGKPVRCLSGGERQKIAIARALCGSPELILADEPTAHQDDHSSGCILDLLRTHADNGCIVIITAHDHRVLSSGAGDRSFIVNGGTIENST